MLFKKGLYLEEATQNIIANEFSFMDMEKSGASYKYKLNILGVCVPKCLRVKTCVGKASVCSVKASLCKSFCIKSLQCVKAPLRKRWAMAKLGTWRAGGGYKYIARLEHFYNLLTNCCNLPYKWC